MSKPSFSLYCIVFSFLISFTTSAQVSTNRIVAKVGNFSISERDYLERYEFTPGIRKENTKFKESSKLEFLYTLIAEKLWAFEATSMEMDTLEVMRFTKKAFEKMFIQDALYQREILNKILISENEMIDGNYKNTITLEINFLFSEDEDEIWHLYHLLLQGVPFDTILMESPEWEEQREPVYIVYGQMEKQIEDSLYNLKIGGYTAPMLTPDGWYIFRLKNKLEQMLSDSEELKNRKESVEKIIKARKERDLYLEFKQYYFSGKKVDVDPTIFESLVVKMSQILNEKKNKESIKIGEPIYFLSDEVLELEKQFGIDTLNMNFILFKDNPVILKQFIRILAFNGFNATNSQLNFIRALIDNQTKEIIEEELLAREGYRLGLNHLPEVQRQVKMWYDNYLFQNLQNKFLDSTNVSEEELFEYYTYINREENYPTLIKIVEIFADSIESIQQILHLVKSTQDFSDLVIDYQDEKESRIKIVESSLMPAQSFGEIGDIALTMEVNDIYGPIKVDNQYEIFRLIEKKESTLVHPTPFESVKENYRSELLKKKLKIKVHNFTTNLALKYGFSIDFDVLDSIDVTNYSSFAIRYLGFGGKMTAVPLVAPNINWINQYMKKINTMQ